MNKILTGQKYIGKVVLYVILNYKEKLYIIVASIPLVTVLLFGPLLQLVDGMFPYLNGFKELILNKSSYYCTLRLYCNEL